MNNQAIPSGEPVMVLKDVTRIFNVGKPTELVVLDQADLTVHRGEIVALVGPSGSGKSTFLHLAGLLEKPDSGDIAIAGESAGTMREAERTMVRRKRLGFVYQFHHLLPEFSALENVVIPQLIGNRTKEKAGARAKALLVQLGLGDRLENRPTQLSGGEQQRVAIARALANEPDVLLADEPTGNLDPKTSQAVFDNLIALVRTEGMAAIIATHNLDLAKKMDRVVMLRDGKLIDGRDLINSAT